MKLCLDPMDLRPEHLTADGADQNCSTSLITFAMLNEKAQAMVRLIGSATFYPWHRDSYNRIVPPPVEAQKEGVET